MKIGEAKNIVIKMITKRIPVMIWGPPGVGKSSIVRDIAKSLDFGLIDVRLSLLQPTDLILPFPNKETGKISYYYADFLPTNGSGILFLDEINGASQIIQGQAYQLVLDRKLATYTLPEGWVIVAAGNRTQDKGVTFTMPAPLANRFVHVEIEPDLDSFKEWALMNGIDMRIVAFLNAQPQYLYSFPENREVRAFPTPRTWEAVSKIISIDDTFNAIAAAVGEGAAAAFKGFMELYGKIPDPESILEGKVKTLSVSKPDVYFAVAGALISAIKDKLTKDRIESFFSFINTNFPVEFQAFAVKDLVRAVGLAKLKLSEIKGYSEWVKNHAEELL